MESPCLGQPHCFSLETHAVQDNLGGLRVLDPAFIRPVGGRGRGLAAIRTQPAFRKPQATGPVPSHHSWREGKRGKKKKVCTPPAQEKQLGILHDGRRATQNSNEKQPQQSPWPSLRPTRAVHADGAGGTAPTPEAVTGNARWPQPVQGLRVLLGRPRGL